MVTLSHAQFCSKIHRVDNPLVTACIGKISKNSDNFRSISAKMIFYHVLAVAARHVTVVRNYAMIGTGTILF